MRISDWSSDVCSSDLNNGVSDRVILYNGLIAQSDGMAMLNVVKGREEYSSMAGIVHPSAVGEVTESINVKTRTIDSLVAEHGLRPALFKVDVAGPEGMVFAGAERKIGRASCRERVCQYV